MKSSKQNKLAEAREAIAAALEAILTPLPGNADEHQDSLHRAAIRAAVERASGAVAPAIVAHGQNLEKALKQAQASVAVASGELRAELPPWFKAIDYGPLARAVDGAVVASPGVLPLVTQAKHLADRIGTWHGRAQASRRLESYTSRTQIEKVRRWIDTIEQEDAALLGKVVPRG